MPMVLDSSAKRRSMWFFGIFIFLIILTYAIVTKGGQGFFAVIKVVLIGTLIAGFIFVLIYIGWKIFFAEVKIDLMENDKKDIINAGTLCKPPLIRDMYFTGDKEHGEMKMGTILGYCQIQNYDKAEQGVAKPEDCFIFKKYGFPINLFEDAKVFRCYPEEHSQLIGDVRIYAISPIFKYGYFFPNHIHLNIRRIDKSVVREAYRGELFETMKDLVTITKRSAGLDSDNTKALEQRKLLKIPSNFEEQESRNS